MNGMDNEFATLSEKIYQDLYNDILAQHLACGQKLTLKMLKERFGVSHTPIREALTRLAENGLVVYTSNSGVTVTTFSDEEIQQLYQFIGELDAFAIRICKSEYNHVPLIYELGEIIEQGAERLANDDIEGWKYYSEEFHETFYRHAGNTYLREAAKKLYAKLGVLTTMYYIPSNVRKIQEEHAHIYEMLKENDFDGAADMMRSHLQMDMVYALKAYHMNQENK